MNDKASTVDALLGRGAKKPPAEGSDTNDVFDPARPRSKEDINLDIRFADGSRVAFQYSYLARLHFAPGDTIRLHFGDAVVVIEGRRLTILYNALLEHRARNVKQGDWADSTLKGADSAHVDSIAIQETEHD